MVKEHEVSGTKNIWSEKVLIRQRQKIVEIGKKKEKNNLKMWLEGREASKACVNFPERWISQKQGRQTLKDEGIKMMSD